jgi:ABC-type lipoprotein release transport system permease subunit
VILPLKIAIRYLFSKKTHNAVNVISIISMVGVAVATMAIVVVLSVFNGFADLSRAHMSMLDPEVKITSAEGKVIHNGDSLADVVSAINGVKVATPVLQERGLAISGSRQLPIVFKGITPDYEQVTKIDTAIIDGAYVAELYEHKCALVSAGVAVNLSLHPDSEHLFSVYVPRRKGHINTANPALSFKGDSLLVSGVYQVNQPDYDNDFMFIPLETARKILEYSTEASAIEIKLADITQESAVIHDIKKQLGDGYEVKNRLQQQEASFHMIAIEKWITFLMLAFILVIASFNIISTLSMLVIEKHDNMKTMRALGASSTIVRRIFVYQGWLISFMGGALGIILGVVLAMAQQYGGFIKLSGDTSQLTIDAYPVKVIPSDLLIVIALVAVVGFITSRVTAIFVRTQFPK